MTNSCYADMYLDVSGTVEIELGHQSRHVHVRFNGNVTIDFQNLSDGCVVFLMMENSGTHTVTWTGGQVQWEGGTPPSQTSNGMDTFILGAMAGKLHMHSCILDVK